jgi:hypothetical protein
MNDKTIETIKINGTMTILKKVEHTIENILKSIIIHNPTPLSVENGEKRIQKRNDSMTERDI